MKKERRSAFIIRLAFGSQESSRSFPLLLQMEDVVVTIQISAPSSGCNSSPGRGSVFDPRSESVHSFRGEDVETGTPFSPSSASACDPRLIHFFDLVLLSCQNRVAVANTLFCHCLSCRAVASFPRFSCLFLSFLRQSVLMSSSSSSPDVAVVSKRRLMQQTSCLT